MSWCELSNAASTVSLRRLVSRLQKIIHTDVWAWRQEARQYTRAESFFFFLLYSPWFQKLPIDFLFYLGRWPWPYPASNEKWTWHDRVLRLNWPVKYPSHDTYLYLNAVALFDVWPWSVLRISSLLLWRLRDHFRRTLAQFGLHDGKLSLPLVWSRRLMVRKESTLT